MEVEAVVEEERRTGDRDVEHWARSEGLYYLSNLACGRPEN